MAATLHDRTEPAATPNDAADRPLRIAHVSSTFPPYWGGTGNVAYHNARVLHERGHRIELFTARAPDDALAMPFPTHRLPAALRFGNAPLTPGLFGRLRGFDLIHLHYPYIFGAELTVAAALRWRTPLVLTYHNQLQETDPVKRVLFGGYNLTAEPLALRAATRVFAVTREHLASLHPRLAASGRAAELPNGVDTATFRPGGGAALRAELGTPRDAPVVLFVGALDQAHRFKNVDGLLRAFARATAQAPELAAAELWVVGDGDLRPALERQAAELGLGSRIRFLGKRPPDALPPYYDAADVKVLPSTSVESFGVVLIEAMACGTAVIASALPGVRTLVRPGEDGWRVPPGDETALARTLTDALTDRERAARYGAAGRAKVERLYDWTAIGARLEALYEEVLATWSSS